MLTPLFLAIGLPAEGIGILIAVDALPDTFATVLNVTGDLAATAIVVGATRHPRSLSSRARDCVKTHSRDDLLFVAWSSGRINKLNANWANSFGLGEFVRMKSGWRLALDETDER